MAKKNYVIDTSVFLTDASCINKFDNNDIIVPLKVLEEIDKHKKRQDSVGFNARQIIKTFDALREKGSLAKGVRLGKGKGLVKALSADKIDASVLPGDLTAKIADHVIISTALTLQKTEPRRKTILVSRDINMRVIADSVGLLSQDYLTEQVAEDADKIYAGFEEVLVDDQVINQFYAGEEIFIPAELVYSQKIKLYPNQFVMLISSANEKKTALCRFRGHANPVRPIAEPEMNWGVKPRNKEQSFALDLLFDDRIPFVSLIGRAGSGKTLMAIAAGIEQTIGLQDRAYNRILISRPVQPMGKDIGFLPGSMEEKMLPWLRPIQDNIQHIMGSDKEMLSQYIEKGVIEIEALTYIRGRSISNAYMVIDEAQNLTAHEVKTILTRVGENTKIVLTGDIEQIDNIYTNETSNGLAYAVEKFKISALSGHITFQKGERSQLATLAAKML
jgi:PhoH-like ATPase